MESALLRDNKCFKCQQTGHFARECPQKNTYVPAKPKASVQSLDKPAMNDCRESRFCLGCGDNGHSLVDCSAVQELLNKMQLSSIYKPSTKFNQKEGKKWCSYCTTKQNTHNTEDCNHRKRKQVSIQLPTATTPNVTGSLNQQ